MIATVTPVIAASLFDSLGVAKWTVVDRATFTSLEIFQIDLPLAKRLKSTYRGSVYRRKHVAYWTVAGRDSELFAEAILPYLSRKRDVVEFYLAARSRVINSNGRGTASTLNDDDLEMRRQIAQEFVAMQKEEL